MKRLFLLIALLFSSPVFALNTSIVQRSMGASSQTSTMTSHTAFFQPPFTLSGNAVLAGFTFASGTGATATCSDPAADTFTNYTTASNGNQVVQVCCAKPTTGTKSVTVTFTGATPSFVQLIDVVEVSGITSCTANKQFGTNGSGTSIALGSQTTTVASFLFQVAEEDGPTVHESWTAGASWALLNATRAPGGGTPAAGQWIEQSVSGPINPTITMNTSDSWVSVAVALPTSATGTAGSGFRVVNAQNEFVGILSGTTTAVTQFPCTSNALAFESGFGPGETVSSITDSNSNTWTQRGTSLSNGGSGELQNFDSMGATCTTSMNITVHVTGSTAGASNVTFFEIAGGASPLFDTTAGRTTATNTQGSGGNLSGSVISPSNGTNVVIQGIVVSNPSVDGVTANGEMACNVPNPFDITNDRQCDNNGAGSSQNLGASTSITWHTNAAVGSWAASSVSYLASSSSGPPTNQYPRVIGKL